MHVIKIIRRTSPLNLFHQFSGIWVFRTYNSGLKDSLCISPRDNVLVDVAEMTVESCILGMIWHHWCNKNIVSATTLFLLGSRLLWFSKNGKLEYFTTDGYDDSENQIKFQSIIRCCLFLQYRHFRCIGITNKLEFRLYVNITIW